MSKLYIKSQAEQHPDYKPGRRDVKATMHRDSFPVFWERFFKAVVQRRSVRNRSFFQSSMEEAAVLRIAFLEALAKSARFGGFIQADSVPELASVAPRAPRPPSGIRSSDIESVVAKGLRSKPQSTDKRSDFMDHDDEDEIGPSDSITSVLERKAKEEAAAAAASRERKPWPKRPLPEGALTHLTGATQKTTRTAKTASGRTVASRVTRAKAPSVAPSVREIKITNADPSKEERRRMDAHEKGRDPDLSPRSSLAASAMQSNAASGFDFLES